MIMKPFFFIFLLPIAFAGEDRELSPTKKFLTIIQERNDTFQKFRSKLYAEEICQGPDYNCVLKELKSSGIQSSGDLDNSLSILSWVAQRRYQRGDCAEVCRMNIYAEYTAATIELLKNFDRSQIVVNLFPKDHPEAKYLLINEELRLYKGLSRIHEKLILHKKKIDLSRIFRPELANRLKNMKEEIEALKPSILLRGSYLSSLDSNDKIISWATEDGLTSEREKIEKKELVTQFRTDIR